MLSVKTTSASGNTPPPKPRTCGKGDVRGRVISECLMLVTSWPKEMTDLCLQYVDLFWFLADCTEKDHNIIQILPSEPFKNVVTVIDRRQRDKYSNKYDLLCGDDMRFKTVASLNAMSTYPKWSALLKLSDLCRRPATPEEPSCPRPKTPEEFSWIGRCVPLFKFGVMYLPSAKIQNKPKIIGGRHRSNRDRSSRHGIFLRVCDYNFQIIKFQGSHYRKDALFAVENFPIKRSDSVPHSLTIADEIKIVGQYFAKTNELRFDVYMMSNPTNSIYGDSDYPVTDEINSQDGPSGFSHVAGFYFPYIALSTEHSPLHVFILDSEK